MKLKEIVSKVSGESNLSEEEKNSPAESSTEVKTDDNAGKEISETVKALNERLEELEVKDASPEELKQRQMSRKLKELQSSLATVSGEKEKVMQELDELKFKQSVTELAAAHSFNDPDYLGFLLRGKQIDPGDRERVTACLDALRENSPQHFNVDASSGSGSSVSPGVPSRPAEMIPPGCRSISEMLKFAPIKKML